MKIQIYHIPNAKEASKYPFSNDNGSPTRGQKVGVNGGNRGKMGESLPGKQTYSPEHLVHRTKSEVTPPLPSRGPTCGQDGYITPTDLGVPNKGTKSEVHIPFQKWLLSFFQW